MDETTVDSVGHLRSYRYCVQPSAGQRSWYLTSFSIFSNTLPLLGFRRRNFELCREVGVSCRQCQCFIRWTLCNSISAWTVFTTNWNRDDPRNSNQVLLFTTRQFADRTVAYEIYVHDSFTKRFPSGLVHFVSEQARPKWSLPFLSSWEGPSLKLLRTVLN